jgi:hypothetical protein
LYQHASRISENRSLAPETDHHASNAVCCLKTAAIVRQPSILRN